MLMFMLMLMSQVWTSLKQVDQGVMYVGLQCVQSSLFQWKTKDQDQEAESKTRERVWCKTSLLEGQSIYRNIGIVLYSIFSRYYRPI